MKYRYLKIVAFFLVLTVFMTQAAFATSNGKLPGDDQQTDKDKGKPNQATRTVLMYVCGSDLESEGGMASFNLKQVLGADFSKDEEVRYVVMTGGAMQWQLDDDENRNNDNGYLVFPEGVTVPDDAINLFDRDHPDTYGNPHSQISNEYNPI